MKKLITLCLSLGLLFSMSGCGSSNKIDEDALDTLVAGLNQMEKMESASYKLGMDVEADKEQGSLYLHGGYLQVEGDAQFSIGMDIASGTEKENDVFAVYYKDKELYLNFLGDKSKTNLSELVDNETKGNADTNAGEAEPIKKEDIKKFIDAASIKGNVVTLKLNKKMLEDSMKESINKSAEKAGGEVTVSIKDAEVIATLENGFIANTEFNLNLVATGNVEGKKGSTPANLKFYLNFSDINSLKELELPDLKEYEDKDLLTMFSELSMLADNMA